MKLSKIL